MFLLSLIAAVSATPLRLAEAAHDFAASVAELGADGVLGAPDGGVGDDSDATIKGETTDAPSPDAGPTVSPHPVDFLRAFTPFASVHHRPAPGLPRPLRSLTGRLAALQCFLC